MSCVYLVSYATERFEAVRQELNDSAGHFGITNHISFNEQDLLTSDYYLENKSILDEVCGAGFWAWKPHFILEALDAIKEDDILFYADAGSRFIQSPAPLIDICAKRPDGLVIFDARPLTNAQFTKRDCFVKLGCDYPAAWHSAKCIATVLVIRKCDRSLQFVSEWKKYCQDRSMVTDDANQCGKENLPEFLQHRHDQAILSVMAAKDGIETYRNPTHWGNYLKLPQFRVKREPLDSPYGLPPPIYKYSSAPQQNSPYGTIFEINRAPNYVAKLPFPDVGYKARWRDRFTLQSLSSTGKRIISRLMR